MAQQVRRAAALTAQLAAQSEKKVSLVCDQPPGLRGELAEHNVAPKMEAGSSHLQTTMMQDPLVRSRRPSASESQATISAPPETKSSVPANKGTFTLTRRVPWSSTAISRARRGSQDQG